VPAGKTAIVVFFNQDVGFDSDVDAIATALVDIVVVNVGLAVGESHDLVFVSFGNRNVFHGESNISNDDIFFLLEKDTYPVEKSFVADTDEGLIRSQMDKVNDVTHKRTVGRMVNTHFRGKGGVNHSNPFRWPLVKVGGTIAWESEG
jgi:hypothetical protein